MTSIRASYEQIFYPSFPRQATAPDRLAAVATLFGLATPDPQTARVLEIGCSDAGNLMALAVATPRGRFLGIDFSRPAIERGRERARELGLTNLELQERDLTEFPAESGTFDYIIVHGVLSWVPAAVAEQLLALVRRHLAPEGIAYIDYNAQPGSQLRYAFRESILFHVRRFAEPQQQVDQARSLLKLIIDANAEGSVQRMMAEQELRNLLRTPDAAVFHDMLGQENHPFFFHEFAAVAARHGLEYLGEADVFEMSDVLLPAAIRERLAGLRGIIDKEQYLDILRSRVFRQTLLCHAGRAISRALDGETLRALFFSAAGEVAPGEREDEVAVRRSFGTMSTTNPLVKAVVALLTEVTPARLDFAELAAEVQRRHPDLAGTVEAALPMTLAHATMSGMVNIHASPANFTTEIAAQPVASALARIQAARGEALFTLNHSQVKPDKAVREILPLLDGTRDQAELARALDCDPAEVEQTLRAVARHALLVK